MGNCPFHGATLCLPPPRHFPQDTSPKARLRVTASLPHPLPEGCSCSALRQAARHLTRLYDEALAPVDLGVNQYSILVKLDRHGPTPLNELAARVVMDRSSLGHLLRPLENRSLVTLGVDARDRRRRHIALTPAGAALVARARPLWAGAEDAFRRAFGPVPAQDLRDILRRVADTPVAPPA